MSKQIEQNLLDELAERFGIAPYYDDIFGKRHPTSNETKRAVLAAMGVRTDTADQVRDALGGCLEALWRRPCDPVLVFQEGSQRLWSFRMPADEGKEHEVRLEWMILDEAGQTRFTGKAGPGLQPIETCVLTDQRYVRFELPVPAGLEIGYYDLAVWGEVSLRRVEGTLRLILVPPHCYLPRRFAEGGRIWGIALQLYALRSAHNWGVGDFGDLAEALEWATELGSGIVGINPLHALKNARPYHISPYSPDSRLYLNLLYIDIEQIPECRESMEAQRLLKSDEFRSTLEAMRNSQTVDYDQVSAAKRKILKPLFETFQERHFVIQDGSFRPTTARGRAFEQYIREEGQSLEQFAVFQALSEEFLGRSPDMHLWQEWPEAYRHPESLEVAAFRASHEAQIRFHQYVQWIAAEQITAVVQRAHELHMPVGLYHDLALGSDRAGSDAWAFQDVFALDADCGAPPDAFALEGQNWGLPPVNPDRLRESGYRMFIELLQKNLRYGGALRLDHVMALFRLFWIPRGMPASAGTYVHYPWEDLLGILALESVRHRAVIIGEDLGTVPDFVREKLAAFKVLSYRVFYFERWRNGQWKEPSIYPQQALAVVSTHDLPTLWGFWAGYDIEVRAKLGMYPDEGAHQAALDERRNDKARILQAIRTEGLLPEGFSDDSAMGVDLPSELNRAIHVYLARTPSWVMLANLDDLLGERAQANLPGTLDSYPNWSLKSMVPVEDLRIHSRPQELAAELRAIRPAKRRSFFGIQSMACGRDRTLPEPRDPA